MYWYMYLCTVLLKCKFTLMSTVVMSELLIAIHHLCEACVSQVKSLGLSCTLLKHYFRMILVKQLVVYMLIGT